MKAIILPSDNKTPSEARSGAMAQIGGVPVIFHVIKMLEGAGVRKIIVCDNTDTDEIKDFLEKSKDKVLGVEIEHFRVDSTLKSAQILEKCKRFDLEKTFFVVPNDVITDLNLMKLYEFHRKQGRTVTACVAECKKYFSALSSDCACESKIVNSEIYAFESEIIDYCENATRLDSEVLLRVAEDDELSIFKSGCFIQRCSAQTNA